MMLALADIKGSINQLLKDKFGYRIYGREVKKGFERPSFFVELLPIGSDNETINFSSNRLTIIVTYFQKAYQDKGYSDLENIKMHDSLKSAFGMTLKVNDRSLLVRNPRSDYAGSDNDILQFSFDLDFLDGTGRQVGAEEMAGEIKLKL